MIQFNLPNGSQELPSVSSSKHTEHNEHSGAVQPSAQALSLIQVDDAYAARYRQCRLDVIAFTTVVQLVADGQQGKGYKQEHTTFRGTQRRAGKIYKLPLDEELSDFRLFLIHVGPKPHYEAANPLSLDRINNLGGYVLGNINWADKAQQSANRRTRKFNLVNGTYMSDSELARHLTNQSRNKISAASVKKNRQRKVPIERQFELCGVPYISGLSPTSNWRFPPDAGPIAAVFIPLRRRHESQIAFFVRFLQEKVRSLKAKIASPQYASAVKKQVASLLVAQYNTALQHGQTELARLNDLDFDQDLVPILLPLASSSTEAVKPAINSSQAAEGSILPLLGVEPGCGYTKVMLDQFISEFQEATKRVAEQAGNAEKRSFTTLFEGMARLLPQERWALKEIAGRHLQKLEWLEYGLKPH